MDFPLTEILMSPHVFEVLSQVLLSQSEGLRLAFLAGQIWWQQTLSFCLSGNASNSPTFLKVILAR